MLFAVFFCGLIQVYVAGALLLDKGLALGKPSAVIAAFGEPFIKTGSVPPESRRYLIRGLQDQ